jgi:hypothetical protein
MLLIALVLSCALILIFANRLEIALVVLLELVDDCCTLAGGKVHAKAKKANKIRKSKKYLSFIFKKISGKRCD